jgi:hypothetical protein
MEGYALLVGVDDTNKRHYGRDNNAPNALSSVEKIYDFLKESTSLNISKEDKFLGNDAIFNDVKLRLEALADLSNKKEGEEPIFLFLYLVGHGHNYERAENEMFTFFKLYDQMLSENEFRELLNKFHPKSKVFCVIDSCYSAGMLNKIAPSEDSLFGIRKCFSKSYPNIIAFYKDKLKHPSCEIDSSKFIIASVGEESWANTSENGMFKFSSYFLSELENNQTKNLNYCDFFDVLLNKFIQMSRDTGNNQIPKLFPKKSIENYFKNNKPLII